MRGWILRNCWIIKFIESNKRRRQKIKNKNKVILWKKSLLVFKFILRRKVNFSGKLSEKKKTFFLESKTITSEHSFVDPSASNFLMGTRDSCCWDELFCSTVICPTLIYSTEICWTVICSNVICSIEICLTKNFFDQNFFVLNLFNSNLFYCDLRKADGFTWLVYFLSAFLSGFLFLSVL